jgi:Lipase (class 3)
MFPWRIAWTVLTVILLLSTISLGILVIYGADALIRFRKVEKAIRRAWFNPLSNRVMDSDTIRATTRVFDVDYIQRHLTHQELHRSQAHLYFALWLGDMVYRLDRMASAYLKRDWMEMIHPPAPLQFMAELSPMEKRAAVPAFGCIYQWENDASTVVIVARGTTSHAEVNLDLQMNQVPMTSYNMTDHVAHVSTDLGYRTFGMVHEGFYQLYQHYRSQIIQAAAQATTVCLAGYSLGGAVMTLAALDLAVHYPLLTVLIYVYGCPRVGNVTFCNYVSKQPNLILWRIVNRSDVLQEMPLSVTPNFGDPDGDTLLYEHVKSELSSVRNSGNWGENHRLSTYLQILEEWYQVYPSGIAPTTHVQ